MSLEDQYTCFKTHWLKLNATNLPTFFFQKQFSGAMDRIIRNNLDILCALHEEGCKWVGCIADYQVRNK